MILPLENNIIERQYAVSLWTTTKGTQPKYYKDGIWYKIDNTGCEGLAEELTAIVLSCSNTKEFVLYTRCEVNGKKGCKSNSFLEEGEQFVSFYNLYHTYYGGELTDEVWKLRTPEERFQFILDFVKETTTLDCTEYLQDILAIDCLIKNPDRHFNNLGVILDKNGYYRTAPIFDNGQGLYQNFQITPPYLEDEEKDEKLVAATISGSFETQMMVAGQHLVINYEELYEKLSEYPNSIAKECLCNQLEKYKKIFSKDNQELIMDKTEQAER